MTVNRVHGGIAFYVPETRRYFRLLDVGQSLHWLKDGRRLLFWDRGVRLMDTQTNKHPVVLSLPEGEDLVGGLGLSSDNRVLYFTVTTSEADVWLLTLKAESRRSGSRLSK